MKNKLYKFKDGKRVIALNKKECPVCNHEFQPRVSKAKYCSKECYYQMKRVRGDRVKWTEKMRDSLSNKFSGKGNPMYGREGYWKGKKRPDMWGSKHPRYKGGYTNDSGYRTICVEGEKEIPEHRYILELHIERKLTDDEVVHHINGIKDDNRIKNLKVMTRGEHMNYHREEIERNL